MIYAREEKSPNPIRANSLHNAQVSQLIIACNEFGTLLLDDKVQRRNDPMCNASRE
jgi:hypothetical protein